MNAFNHWPGNFHTSHIGTTMNHIQAKVYKMSAWVSRSPYSRPPWVDTSRMVVIQPASQATLTNTALNHSISAPLEWRQSECLALRGGQAGERVFDGVRVRDRRCGALLPVHHSGTTGGWHGVN